MICIDDKKAYNGARCDVNNVSVEVLCYLYMYARVRPQNVIMSPNPTPTA